MKKILPQKARRILEVLLCIALLGAAALSVLTYISYHFLSVTHVTVNADGADGVRIAVISDLHDGRFGDRNGKLISRIRDENVDLILVIGDMLNADSDGSDAVTDLCRKLDAVAPTYYALGNHEYEYMANTGEALVSLIESVGVPVLDLEYEDVTVNGTDIRIGGMYDYAFGYPKDADTDAERRLFGFLEDFSDTDSYTVMLAHRPDSFIFGNAAELWDIDLVLSGHTHGGQVRIPLLGGLYAPDQGLFPKYDYGLYEKGLIKLFITRGLGSPVAKVPRVNNLPEIAVIELSSDGTEK